MKSLIVFRSIAFNHLRQQWASRSNEKRVAVAVIYLKYNDPQQTLNNILASVLRQLVEEQEVIPDFLQSAYEHHCDNNASPTLQSIKDILKAIVLLYAKVFMIVDGLDECSEDIRWALTEQLRDMPGTVYVMITSRVLDSIREELEDFVQMEIKAHKSDIELFIDRQIRKNRNLRKIVQKNPAMRQDIKEGVVKTAENM